MGLKTKVKSYSFWVSLASALILISKLLGQKFGFVVDEGLISDLFTSFCGILVILGIIVVPSPSLAVSQEKTQDEKKIEEKEEKVLENKIKEEQIQKQTQEKTIENEILTEEKVCENIINNETSEIVDCEDVTNDASENSEETLINEENNINSYPILEVKNEYLEIKENLTNKEVDIQKFIDEVCLNRAKLNNNITNFLEFLQEKIDEFKN